MAESRTDRRALAFVFLVVLLDMMGVGILLPVIPYLVEPYGADGVTVGLLMVAFSAAQFVCSPLLGALSDRYGRRPVLILSVLGTGVGYVLFGIGGALWVFFLSRVIDGATGANIVTAQAFIADVSPPHERGKNFGLIGAAFGIGFIIGPALGGMLAHVSLSAPAWAAAALALVTAAVGYFVLPESLAPERRRTAPLTAADLNPLASLVVPFRRPALLSLFTAIVFVGLGMAALRSNFSLFAFRRFGFTPQQVGTVFAYIGVLGTITQGVILRRVSGKVADHRLAAGGLLATVVGFIGLALAPSVPLLYLATTVHAVGNGLSAPVLQAMLSQGVGGREQGEVLGANQGLLALTQVIGPALAGGLFDHVGFGAPYVASALMAATALGALAWSRSPARRGAAPA